MSTLTAIYGCLISGDGDHLEPLEFQAAQASLALAADVVFDRLAPPELPKGRLLLASSHKL